MLITGNTSLLLFTQKELMGSAPAPAGKLHWLTMEDTNEGSQWNETCTGLSAAGQPAPQFTPAKFTYVNVLEHDDSLSLNLTFVFTVKGPNTSALMAVQESNSLQQSLYIRSHAGHAAALEQLTLQIKPSLNMLNQVKVMQQIIKTWRVACFFDFA